jgi:hypothetical protein
MHPVFDYLHQRRLKKAQIYDNTRFCQFRGRIPSMETPMRGERYFCSLFLLSRRKKEEGRRKKEEGRRKKEEGRSKK